MRITNNIIKQTSLDNSQRNLREMHKAQVQISSGKRVQSPSDDPIAAMDNMRARTSIRSLDQYRRGVQTALSRAEAEESALDQLTTLMIRAREVGTMYGSDTVSAAERRVGRAEVESLLRQAVSIANTRFADGYLFGGVDQTNRPYAIIEGGQIDFSTTGPFGTQQIEISENQFVPANRNGTEIFDDSGLLTSLRDLAHALGDNDANGIRTAMLDVDSAFDSVQNWVGEIGARTNRLLMTTSNLDSLEVTLLTLKSDAEDADIEKAITELVGRQTAYQAALMATSQVMNLNLTNYLR
jgi:flagellar hook-associated protein 3 FlgL